MSMPLTASTGVVLEVQVGDDVLGFGVDLVPLVVRLDVDAADVLEALAEQVGDEMPADEPAAAADDDFLVLTCCYLADYADDRKWTSLTGTTRDGTSDGVVRRGPPVRRCGRQDPHESAASSHPSVRRAAVIRTGPIPGSACGSHNDVRNHGLDGPMTWPRPVLRRTTRSSSPALFQRRAGVEAELPPGRLTSRQRRGWPSGLVASQTILPSKPTSRAMSLRQVSDRDLAAAAQVDRLGRVVFLHRRDERLRRSPRRRGTRGWPSRCPRRRSARRRGRLASTHLRISAGMTWLVCRSKLSRGP